MLTEAQHIFRAGRSPQTNLIEFVNVTTKWMDDGKSFDILYLDFSKAFDKVQIRVQLNERPPLLGKMTVAPPPRAQYVEARGMIEVSFDSL